MKIHKLPRNSAFCTANSTNKYAVVIDGYFGLFDTLEQADDAWGETGGEGGDDCGDTPFGYCELLPPNINQTRDYLGNITTNADLADFTPIDIKRFIKLRHKRLNSQHHKIDILAQQVPGRIIDISARKKMWEIMGE